MVQRIARRVPVLRLLGPAGRPYRDPRRARVLGAVLPGAGHVYAGEYFSGYVLGVGAVGLLALGPAMYRYSTAVSSPDECSARPALICRTGGRSWTGAALGVLATATGAAVPWR